jgi:hypothetical protein
MTIVKGVRLAADFVAPTLLFYVLTGMGTSVYLALLGSALLSAASGIASFVLGARQGLALPMLVITLLQLALAFVTGSDRFLLARESVLTAAVAVIFLVSLRWDRPLTYTLTRPMLEGRGRWKRDWDSIWQRDPSFRRPWRVTTVMWSAVTFADAVTRVVMAYTLPVESVPGLDTVLMIITFVVMQVVTNVYYVSVGLWPRLRDYPGWNGPAGQRA